MSLVTQETRRIKQLFRQTFELKVAGIGSVMLHTLTNNPEDMQQEEPARVSVTQTLGGAFVTDFGQGLPTVTLSGTTGYRRKTTAEGRETDGFQEFQRLRNRIYRGFIETNDPKLSLYWYNWEDDEYYQIQPTSFRLMRNKSEPLLYRYEFRFTCIRRLKGTRRQTTDGLIDPRTDQVWRVLTKSSSRINELLTTM